MKILHISPSYIPAYVYGGPTVSVGNLCESQANLGHFVFVYTTTANGGEELEVETDRFVQVNNVKVWYFKRNTGDHTHISFQLWIKFWKSVKNFDVVHVHSWWNVLVLGVVFICWLKGIKPVLSIRGMLSDYSFSQKNSFKKKVIHLLFGKFLLKNTFLHATTPLEWDICKKIIPTWEGFIGYNLINLPNVYPCSIEANSVFKIGVLSRLDPVKGIELVLTSLSKVNFKFHLLIAGNGEPEYVFCLKKLVKELNLEEKVFFQGWKSNEEKFHFLSDLDLLVVASTTENFSNVVIESLSVGTAVLVSDQVGLANLILQKDWGWVTKLDVNFLRSVLESAYVSDNFRSRIRKNSPADVRSIFSEQVIVQQYIDAYRKFYGEGI